MLSLYNEEFKNEFLEKNYYDETAKANRYVLAKAKYMEEQLELDLYDFNYDQLDSFYHDLRAKTEQSIYSWHSVIKAYIQFAINKGYITINYADTISDLKKYVSKIAQEKKYLSREDVYEIAENSINAQDGIIPVFLFEGVSIQNNLEEICNLKDTDIEDNVITVGEGEHKRKIVIPDKYADRFIYLIKETINQTYYNKIITSNDARSKTLPLDDTPYIIKPSKRKDKVGQKTNAQLIYSRFSRLREEYGNGFISPSTVWYSGMIDYAKRLKKELGIEELDMNHYKKISEAFGGYSDKYYFTIRSKIKDLI